MSRRNNAETLRARTLVTPDGCWEWQGKLLRAGYGEAHYRGRQMVAHRAMWLAVGREIPAGLQLDHLCNNRRCCNPDHLEPVTSSENVKRGWQRGRPLTGATARNAAKTHCNAGHELAGDNLYRWRGGRICRACNRTRQAEAQARKREGSPA